MKEEFFYRDGRINCAYLLTQLRRSNQTKQVPYTWWRRLLTWLFG